MPKGNLFYAQSGGVTAVINATASAVITEARARKVRVLAGRNGILGALREELIDTSREPAAAIRAQWRDSVDRLADVLGAPVEVASIPGGFYSPEVAASAIGCGIRWLFTSEPVVAVARQGPALLIGRYAMQRGMGADAALAFARGTGTARQRQWLLWNIKKPAKRLAGPAYRWLRRRSFGGD